MPRKISTYIINFIICIVPLIITPWEKDYYYEPKAIAIYAAAVLLLIVILFSKRNVRFIDYPIAAFAFLIILSTFFSVDFNQSLWGRLYRKEGTLTLLSYLLFLYAASKFYKFSKGAPFFYLFTISLICIYAISQYYGFDPIPKDFLRKEWIKGYAYGTIGNPNFLGSLVTLSLPIALFAFLKGSNIYIIPVSIIYLTLLCTMTRSAYLGSLLSCILFFILSYKYKFSYKRLITILLTIVFITVSFNSLNEYKASKRFNTIIEDTKKLVETGNINESAGTKRLFIWKRTFKLIYERPLLGSGPDTFDIDFMGNYKQETIKYFGNLTIDKAHNEYLQMAVTLGIPALLSYLFIVFYILRRAALKIKENILIIPLICSISGYLIQAFFNISVVSVAPVYYCFLGILYSFTEPCQ